MNIIVCLEDKNGMMFNKRRLSQDVAIREDIYKNMDGKSLIIRILVLILGCLMEELILHLTGIIRIQKICYMRV